MTQSNHQEARSKLIQIFRYLQALNNLRNPVQREVNEQRWVLWFHDLPDHPCIRRGVIAATLGNEDDSVSGDDFILKVSRPKLTEPPEPPRDILPWLKDGWQRIDGSVAVEASIVSGTDSQTSTINFDDAPQRRQQLEEWKLRRDTWVKSEMSARVTHNIFDKLYALQSQLDRESERVELVLGDGLLTWDPKGSLAIHHPVLLLRLQIQFDPEIPEFTLLETGHSSELYTALFQALPDVKAEEIAYCRAEHEQERWHPLENEDVGRFLKKLANRLSSHGVFLEQGKVQQNKQEPCISRDPVLFLRNRTLGISTALESILEILPQIDNLPYSLTSLTGIDSPPHEQQYLSTSQTTYTSNGEDEYILLSKPANAEQVEVAQRLERHGAVLVQGPPGTGKTHTIANLIGHLLAQGKSVLVTSEKSKALRVLREKVVPPLQPLCVSIMGDDNRKQMESAINAISERLANSNVHILESEATTLNRRRIDLLRQLRTTRELLVEARSSEYRPIVVAGEAYEPSAAARHVTQFCEANGWIPGPVIPGRALPLTVGELLDLYHSNTSITPKDEQEMVLFLPEAGNLLAPLDFERLVREQAQQLTEDFGYRRDLWLTTSQSHSPEAIQELQKRLIQEIEPLRDLTGWRLAALAAGREGGPRRQVWDDLLHEVEEVYSFAVQAQLRILKYDPVVPQDCLPDKIEKVIDEIVEYQTQGGALNGFKLFTKPNWKRVIRCANVNNKPPVTVEHFEALRDIVRLRAAREHLLGRWQRQMTVLGGPAISTPGPEPETTFHQFVKPLHQCLQWFSNAWAPLEHELRQQGFRWDALLTEIPVNHHENSESLRLRTAIEKLPAVIAAEIQRRLYAQREAKLQALGRTLEQAGGSRARAEVVQQLHDAVVRRDPQAYRVAYESIADLHAKKEILQRRRALLVKLEQAAPAWAGAIRERTGIHGTQHLPGNPEDGWLWRQLSDELDRRARTSLQELQEKIAQLNNELFRTTAELVEKKAWAAQVQRTSLQQRQALQQWRELMKKVGKGTGKRVPRLLADAQKLMPICQTAVPVWIMPLSHVARNFDMQRNRFDVVIIDEASQADITALIAVYLGNQVVVVGDDEQVSPLAVGQRADEVNHLIDEHLKGIQSANLYDGKFSIYGLARAAGFNLVCLLEHFRCVSPIIKFSNELSYENKIKPLRDDSEVQRRPATVAYQVKSCSRSGKVNEEEAIAVASLLLAATEQPEYKDATFGVISMLGEGQALRIEQLLRQYMSPAEYVQRRVLCGDAAQFQGDERDVMFLSLVDVPGEDGGPLPLRNEEGKDDMYKKRYNVAASRARDQMWVVYSLDPHRDLKPNDIRRRLVLHAIEHQCENNEYVGEEQKVESEFEKQVFQRLKQTGYSVITQWPVGAYRIDMVVEGNGKRLAVECDGDRWHPQEKLEEDMARQAILERLGWRFVRIRGSQFFRNPEQAMAPLFARLHALDILPEAMLPDKSETIHGSELKARIVRRADELRQQWEANESKSTQPVSRQNGRLQGNRERKETTAKPQMSPVVAMSTSNLMSEAPILLPDTTIPYGTNEPTALLNGKQNSISDAFNKITLTSPEGINSLIAFLCNSGLRVIDKRASGGTIWVMGGSEHTSIMQKVRTKGVVFILTQKGGQATQYRPSWYMALY